MKFHYKTLQPVKFRIAVFGLLCGATVISLCLFRMRNLLSGSADYAFLIWNLLLAWIPLGIAYAASIYARRGRYILWVMPISAIMWLVFFPNAPYLLTDLQHLRVPRTGVPLWFDILLLLWFSWTALLLGLASLFLMHDLIARAYGRWPGWGFVLSVGVLSSLGIYMGRFLRWNSWDVFFRPLERLSEFMYYATHPSLRAILFIGTFSGFLLFLYLTLYTFGLLFREAAKDGT